MDVLSLSLLTNLALGVFSMVILIPILIVVCPATKWSRKYWVRFVKWKHPKYIVVEENTIRSILDQGRNHGIYAMLVQGRTIADGARSHLLRLSSQKKFLRFALTTRWGIYVWKENDYFSVDKHLLRSPCSFRGRPITESNIQDYVSDVTSKFLPGGQSPWQVYVINCFLHGVEYQICLIRAHHLLLRQEHLSLADFLPLKFSVESWACRESDSPFTNLYAEPSALPRLHQKLTENFSNYWNEFLYDNDPNERPEILKIPIGIFRCAKIGIIVLVSTWKELTRQYKKTEGLGFLEVFAILRREAKKRNFSFTIVLGVFLRAFDPVEAFYALLAWAWYLAIFFILKVPILLLRELKALQSSQDRYNDSHSLTSIIKRYLPLIFQATMEAFSIGWIAVRAPKLIFEELFSKHQQSNSLQTISPCGRKIVAWSEVIDLDVLEKIGRVTSASVVEILLTSTVHALQEYFRHSEARTPDDVFATAKFVSQNDIFLKNHESRGTLCLALPTKTPLFEDDPIEVLQVIRKNVQEVRSKQSAIYAVTAVEESFGLIASCLPSVLLKIALNQLSRRYSLSLTHVDGNLSVEGVDAVLYWRPPQGNCNMSITLHRYGNGVRLGIMADALLGPQHSIVTRTFSRSLENFAKIVGVPKTPTPSLSPSLTSPTTSPGY